MSDTQNPGGWSDASKPGVPLHPERDGLHYITDAVALWEARPQKWRLLSRTRAECPEWLAAQPWAEYRGPCPEAHEVKARVAAARREGIEMAAKMCADFRSSVQNELDHASTFQMEAALAAAISGIAKAEVAIRALLEDKQ